MNRREWMKRLAGVATAAGLAGAKPGMFTKDPEPLLFTLRVDRPLPAATVAMLHRAWENLWKGAPPAPLMVIPAGMRLSKMLIPRDLSS